MEFDGQQVMQLVITGVAVVGLVLGLVRCVTAPLTQQVKGLRAEMNQLRAETNQLRAEMIQMGNDLRAEMAQMRAETAQQFAQVNAKLDMVVHDIAVLRERVARVEERVHIPAEPLVTT